jgi:wyosine [tRNA(Phe)-imidazoG37] synthetase (radical SAM superfamily)
MRSLMRYIYGPVKSRRLGSSLGITVTPCKVCSFGCVYCQLGRTTLQTLEIKEYIKAEEIIRELNFWLQNNAEAAQVLNYITFSGSGEPTLNSQIGHLIAEIKKITPVPVAVITNASLLSNPQVRRSIGLADLIIPSLDAATPEVFARVNRPHESLKLAEIIQGLISLRKEFSGKIWLEVMLVRGINDDLRQIKKLNQIIEEIKPQKIQINSPVRSTSEPNILAVDKTKLEKIKEILGEKCEII